MPSTPRDLGEIRLGDTITADRPPACCDIPMVFCFGIWACPACTCELEANPAGRVTVDPAEDRAHCPAHH